MRQLIDLNNIANGALLEKANQAMQQIVDNIADPNTDSKKTRSITIKIEFKANEERDLAQTEINVKAALAPTKGTSTKFLIGETDTGFTAGEMKSSIPGQFFVDADGEVKDDKGIKVSELEKAQQDESEKVVKFS